jgi:chemotaxis protein CheY-P-specific phosphatase CheC
MDVLKEITTIGAAHASTALSEMTKSKILITFPKVSPCQKKRYSKYSW